MNQFKQSVRPLGSIAVPVIEPGPFSARNMLVNEDDGSCAVNLDVARRREPKTPRREESEEVCSDARGTCTAGRGARNQAGRSGVLTSSVVKGEAANGLLELRRATGVVGVVGIFDN
jgi:hypothetical protein